MSDTRVTYTYEGRVPAKPRIEQGELWIPVAHHIEGVFENRDNVTTITYERAEGELADETLKLAEEYRALHAQTEHTPHPEVAFSLETLPTLPQGLDAPIERAGWQIYRTEDTLYASHSSPAEGQAQVAYYRLHPKDDDASLSEALERFERAIVEHGRKRIRLKQVNTQMQRNAETLRSHMEI
ncbi:hypothetical protein [Litchfieldella xinjiangensis]|uniref:hypothetical protein n=1 Tax=Litchfieldella xinjiangensis TaxID=1166948 RepID=UPI0005B8C9E7|nr:hypothetical protein [Halomonas xinjiangensis]